MSAGNTAASYRSLCDRFCHIIPRQQAAYYILNSKARAAACEAAARADLRDANCGPSPGEAAGCCALRAQIILQNESRVFHLRAAACGVRASSATNCGPPPGGGCGLLDPNGPIPTRDKLAAERTGLRRVEAALRPGGGCGIADRCAIDFTGKHFHPNQRLPLLTNQNNAAGCRSQSDRFRWQTLPPKPAAAAPDEPKQCCRLPVAARPNSPPKAPTTAGQTNNAAPPGPAVAPKKPPPQLRTFTFLFLTFTASPSIELPCTEITSRPPSELE